MNPPRPRTCTITLFAMAATLFTLFVVPVAYDRLAQNSGSPGDTRRRLERELPDQD